MLLAENSTRSQRVASLRGERLEEAADNQPDRIVGTLRNEQPVILDANLDIRERREFVESANLVENAASEQCPSFHCDMSWSQKDFFARNES